MMGSPYYYDVHFDPFDVVLHDCMWSGTCCIQLVRQQLPQPLQQAPGTQQQQQPSPPQLSAHLHEQEVALLADPQPTPPTPPTPPQQPEQPEQPEPPTPPAPPTRQARLARPAPSAPAAVLAPAAVSSTRKKLRHREVEKNRHRQLQAMVKTLSERIPGKIEKETQVQTMRRAARYCLYLHYVLTHGHLHLGKDKLERLYMRSCKDIDLMKDQD